MTFNADSNSISSVLKPLKWNNYLALESIRFQELPFNRLYSIIIIRALEYCRDICVNERTNQSVICICALNILQTIRCFRSLNTNSKTMETIVFRNLICVDLTIHRFQKTFFF